MAELLSGGWHVPIQMAGWSSGAMMLGKHSVSRRPSNLGDSRTRA